MKIKLSSALSIVLLGVMTFSLVGNVTTVLAADVCNAASFVADVTIPDGTYIQPGASFTKIWRVRNVGTCAWSNQYSLVFVSGERMSALSPIFLPRYVSPGQTVDLPAVEMVAPTTGGTYRGYWMLQTGSGSKFGVGAGYANPFWVEIRVLAPTEATVAYDFVAEMCSAAWGYDGGPIPCPVNYSKKDYGYVLKIDDPILENGVAAGAPGLLTVPQNKYNGAIHGAYPVDDIVRGDHFQAIIGCQYGAVNCAVRYQIDYLQSSGMVTLWKFKEQYDGLYYQVDLDLTPVANRKNALIVLSAYADGPSVGDQPLWIAPRIVRNTNAPVTPNPLTPTAITATLTPVTPTTVGPTPTTVGPTPTPTSIPGADCNRAQFISDISVPDGTTFAPNSPFTKTWRLKNVGSCTWTTAYSLAFVSGDRMGGVDTLIPQNVVPGQTVDLGVNLTAPPVAGSYRGYWDLKDASGNHFGVGLTYTRPFYVDIKVSGSTTTGTTVLDFVTSICTAQWFSGAGALPCPGSDGDARGFAFPMTSPTLENGTSDPRGGLITEPQNVFNGFVQGVYPTFTVQSGDRFQGTLNCQYGATDCFVIFRLDVLFPSGATQNFLSIGERYDGLYYPADIDLSSLAGQNVRFILTVLANGDATGDRALWVAPRIVRTQGGTSPTLTPTLPPPGPTSTFTPVPPTSTFTPVPPTSTFTPVPPTSTFTPVPATPTVTPYASGWKLVLSTTYAFAFQVPPDANISSQSDTGARVYFPIIPGTNLREKWLDMAVWEGLAECKAPQSNPVEPKENVTFNGVQFLKEITSEGAAGNRYDWVSYSTRKGTACINLTFYLHSLSPGAMETPPPLFDPVAESAVFSTVMSTYGNR